MSFDRNSNFNREANFTGVKFGENKPVLEVELNELQEIQNEARAEIVRDSIPSGFVQLGELDYDYMLNNENCVKLKTDSVAYVNGYKIAIPKDTIINIGKAPEKEAREDLLFLEVWKEEVTKDSVLTKNGGEGQVEIPNNIKDNRYPIETSRRVALKWRIRHVADVDFNKVWNQANEGSDKYIGLSANGDEYSKIYPQGALSKPIERTAWFVPFQNRCKQPKTFIDGFPNATSGDPGLWSNIPYNPQQFNIGTVDNIAYAIPMFRLYRKPSCGKAIPFEYQKINPKVDYSKFTELMKEERVERVVSENISGRSLYNLATPKGGAGAGDSAGTTITKLANGYRFQKSNTNTFYPKLPLLQPLIKPNTTYTISYTVKVSTSSPLGFCIAYGDAYLGKTNGNGSVLYNNELVTGTEYKVFHTFTTLSATKTEDHIAIGFTRIPGSADWFEITDLILVEGNIPREKMPKYFDGLKSLSEEEGNLVEVKTGILNESSYDPSTGTPKLNTVSGTNYISSDNLLTPNIEGQVKRGEEKVSDLTTFGKVDSLVGDEKVEFTKIKGKTLQNLINYKEGIDNSSSLVKPNTTYTIIAYRNNDGTSQINVAESPSNFNTLFIKTNATEGIYKLVFTTKNDTNLLRVVATTSPKPTLKDVILLEGDHTNTPLDQIPFIEGIKSVGENENNKIVVKRVGKNLFNKSETEINKVVNILDGSIFTESKTSGQWYLSKLFKLNSSTTKITIYNGEPSIRQENIRYRFLDVNTNPIKGMYADCTYTDGYCVLNKPSNAEYIQISVLSLNLDLDKVEMYEGDKTSERVSYLEYKQEITLKEPLRSLPNGVCDTIEGNKVIRRVGKLVLNGTENWVKSSVIVDNYMGFFLVVNICKYANTSKICDRFSTGMYSEWESKVAREFIENSEETIGIRILSSKLSSQDVQGFKTWLSQNPTTVYYELANPVEELIEPNYDKESIKTYQLDQPLRSLPNGVKDEIVGNKLIRRCGELLIDKNIKILDVINTTSFDNYNLCQVRVPEAKNIDTDSISSILSTLPLCRIADRANVGYMNNLCVVKGNDGILRIQLLVAKTITTNVEFRTWLESNPVKVVYELATPIEIPLKEVLPSQANFSLARQFNYSDNYLLELPNGVKDTIEGNKVTRRVKKVVLNGSENWIDSTDGTTVQRFCTDDLGLKNNGDTVVNVFANIPTYTRTELYNSDLFGISSALSTGNYSKSVVVGIESSKLSANTIQAFKTWLSQNPITVMFELATPTTEELSGNNNRYCPYHKEDNTYCGSLYVGNGTNDTYTDTVIKSEEVIIDTPFRESTGKLVVTDCKYKATDYGYDLSVKLPGGKNLIDYKTIVPLIATESYFIDDGIVVKGTRNYAWKSVKLFIGKLKPKTTYTLSFNYHINSGKQLSAIKYNTGKNLNVVYDNGVNKFTTLDDGSIEYFIELYCSDVNATALGEVIYTKIQLEEGEKSSYEKYKGVYRAFENTESNDMEDLRHQVSLTGFNYEQILNESFDKLLRGEL